MSGLSQLRELAFSHSRTRYPNMPEAVKSTRNYTDKTANGLTKCIIDYCRMNGHLAERTGCTGRYIDRSKVVTDIFGSQRRIGSGKWIPTSGTKGTSDLKLLINGISIACEIKMQGDRMRPDQVKYKSAFERAGGRYITCGSLDEFMNFYNEII